MSQTIEAIYEDGLLKPLQPLDLPKRECVSVLVEPAGDRSPEEIIALAEQVFEGFTPEEIQELESLILDRQHFLTREPGG